MTAIEWFAEQMITKGKLIPELFENAKVMEKQQIIDAYEDGTYHNTFGNENYESSEEYYNKIFKSE
jgi:hypothetical protein